MYKESVESRLVGVPLSENLSCDELDERVDTITEILLTSYKDSCPLKKSKARINQNRYWTRELTTLRTAARKADTRFVACGYSYGSSIEMKETRRAFKKALRRAQRISWREFTEETRTMPQASRLYKILAADPTVRLGQLEKPNGEYTTGIEETLDFLLDAHFPPDQNRGENGVMGDIWPQSEEAQDIVTTEAVRRAISSFGPYKAAGPDEIFPAMLMCAPDDLTLHLAAIMRSSLATGYVPKKWRKTRVVFIPKPGKDSYDRASSWRPISLTSFLLKTMERVIDRYLRTPILVERLQEAGQCAYLRGISTEAAMHRLVAMAERALRGQEVAIAVFLDIEGAFSHATTRSLISAMRREGLSELCIRWVRGMLENRSVEADLNGIKRRRAVERGCPQGGVLSPLLWILLVSEVLVRLKRYPQLLSQAFADDLGLLQFGPDIEVVRDIVQQGLKIIATWCEEVDLGAEAKKSQAMVFSRKRKDKGITPLFLRAAAIPYVEEVRYLGIFIDNKLSWAPHCRAKARRASVALAQCRRAIGKTWGLSPKVILWLYTAVIRPVLSYGAVAWFPAVYKQEKLKHLQRVQRQVLLSICGVMSSTPTASMECLLDLPPMDIYLEGVAMKTMARLKRKGLWKNWQGYGRLKTPPSHITCCSGLERKIPEMGLPCDHVVEFINPIRSYEIIKKTREEWRLTGSPARDSTLQCYTDGSKISGTTGAACHIVLPLETVDRCYPLGRYPTVYQSEVFALTKAAEILKEIANADDKVNIYVDASSALDSLTSDYPQGGLVRECAEALNKLGEKTTLCVYWIPAHQGFSGNEKADELAKLAAQTMFLGPEPSIPVSIKTVTGAINGWVTEKHRQRWTRLEGHRQTKEILVSPSKGTGDFCRRLTRRSLRLIVQIVTGHCLLASHATLIGVANDPLCPLCRREEEDRDHFLCRCEALCQQRMRIFGTPFLAPEDLRNISLPLLLDFIDKSKRFQIDLQGV
jgi:ribonuclease HI